ncbi:DUF6325 family protein [Rathayibacter soli]|uniref:DUF6325 family protein n=1 Tax=Rathayibacter soli TaxID=3144168 RepID=UPI0027E58CE1|nr:DUF6325 family protein [Glaciibacter superstes]
MTLGPVEILTLVFPGNKFSGEIIPELSRLVDTETITIIDGLFVTSNDRGETTYLEFDELGANNDATVLNSVIDHIEGLISDEDVEALTSGLQPGDSAAILVFEHTWAKGLREAVVNSGGIQRDSVRVPASVVAEVTAAIAAAE